MLSGATVVAVAAESIGYLPRPTTRRGQPSLPLPQQLALHLFDRLGDGDAARARLGAVVGRAAAPHAVHARQHLHALRRALVARVEQEADRKSTRLNSSHVKIS